MVRRLITGVAAVAAALAASARMPAQPLQTRPSLPIAPVRPVTDDYFGTKVIDNYRYMENLKDPEVQAWFKAENDYTRATLGAIPGRDALFTRIRDLDQSDPVGIFNVRRHPGEVYFYEEVRATDDTPKIYMRRGLSGEERLLVDPERIPVASSSRGKGKNTLQRFRVSDDDKYVAVGIVPGGSENDTEVHVIDVATGHETGDVMLRAHGGVSSWLPDNRSFIYHRLQDLPPGAPATELQKKEREYVHVLGTDPKQDAPIFGYGVLPSIDVEPVQNVGVERPVQSGYVFAELNPGVAPESTFYVEPVDALATSHPAWRKLADLSDQITDVAVHGDDLYLLTFKNASRYKIIRTDARHPDLASAEVVVPPGDAVVTGMNVAQDALYVQVSDGGSERILRVPYGPKPASEQVVLPLAGSVDPQGADPRVPGILLGLSSATQEYEIYAYDPETKRVTNTGLERLGPYSHTDDLEVVNVKAKSYDGTLVPLVIVSPKGLTLDGSHPTRLEGYGAYGAMSTEPGFDPVELTWSERGGVRAFCGVRGGGEYGEDWHLAGKGPTKPNTWRDFIACAEYLIDKKYTSPARLAGQGSSAGGILIGRAITERPDLFGVAIIGVGCLDMLRLETTANGPGNVPEFGSTKTEDGFKALLAMSSYHHVVDHTSYPAVLLTTGINDPRVDSWEPGKMAARLQAATSSGRPILLSVDYSGGHGGNTLQQFEESTADVMSFALWQMGLSVAQPGLRKQ